MNTTSTTTLNVRTGITRTARSVVSVFSFVNEAANAAFWFVFDAFFAEYYYFYFAQKRFVPVMSTR